MTRQFWVLIHRYAGLYMAFFLIVAGLTGSILAFRHQLEHWLNPEDYEDYYHVQIQANPMLDPFELRDRALALEPDARCDSIQAHTEADKIFTLDCETPTGKSEAYEIKKIGINPYTGERIPISLPSKINGEVCHWPLTRKNIIDCTYLLHFTLLLDEAGMKIFGIAALVWAVDCFVGFYLTLPKPYSSKANILARHSGRDCRNPKHKDVKKTTKAFHEAKKMISKLWSCCPWHLDSGNPCRNDELDKMGVQIKPRSFWQRWQVAWKVKWPTSTQRLNFDLHRGGGLWFWPFLFIFAWSSVMFNLPDEIYKPVMKQLFEVSESSSPYEVTPDLPQPLYHPPIDFRDAHVIAKRLMEEQAHREGFTSVLEDWRLFYVPTKGLYSYQTHRNRYISDISLWFDATSGALKGFDLMTGEKSGDTIYLWLISLHMATVWGLPYRIFVCVLGLVITMLSVTGVYIWWKKRRVSKAKQIKMASAANMPGLG